jgi:hypothetical protein
VTLRTIDAVLRRQSAGVWATEALDLPMARVIAVLDAQGASVPFQIHDGTIVVTKRALASLTARIELSEDLVTASALEQMKLDLEREKLASGERSTRRTLVVSVATAVVTAIATIAVAYITNIAGEAHKPQPAAYRELNECREGLDNLKTLANLDQQTLPDLRTAVRRQVDDCSDRLRAAMSASSP